MVLKPLPARNWRFLDVEFDSARKNLAFEEALARVTDPEVARPTVRLWRNPPSVIVGRFQDPRIEADMTFCESEGIPIVRRFTGGGAVFHDEGNLNLTMLTPPLLWSLSEIHATYSRILIEFLKSIGLRSQYVPPNSVLIDGKKVAGAAAARTQRSTLWHTCILVSTNLKRIERTLSSTNENMETRFVRSTRFPVTTLEREAELQIEMSDVKAGLIDAVKKICGGSSTEGNPTDHERKLLTWLYERKYSSVNWNLNGLQENLMPINAQSVQHG